MKFKTRRWKRREALKEAEEKENKIATKPDIIPEEPKPKSKPESKKKTIKEDKTETEISLPPRRNTKPKSGK